MAKHFVTTMNKRLFNEYGKDLLIGDSTKAREQLGWKPKYDLDMLITDMLEWDLKRYG